MLLELNLTGKSITWLKMISTRCSVNIKLTSINMKNASLEMREAFSYFQNFAFDVAIQCFNYFFHLEKYPKVLTTVTEMMYFLNLVI